MISTIQRSSVPVHHERLDERGAVEHDLVLDRPAQPHDLEQVLRAARVDGDGARAVGGDVGAQQDVAHALDVVAQRHALVVREPVALLDLVRAAVITEVIADDRALGVANWVGSRFRNTDSTRP